ncbi:MAG: efflux RND transporter periplasmic adaptor subunit [Saprospiraceae bacterium]|nr:efflux RND transporter periplasmic adaptor subunit [Saprospiraceae bacterium]
MKQVWFATTVVVLMMSYACVDNANPGHTHGPDAQTHAPEAAPLSYTIHSPLHELFVEFAPLVAGQLSSFAAHWTRMDDYQPVEEGRLIVRLVSPSGQMIENGSPAPSSRGLFVLSLTPEQQGTFDLHWILLTEHASDTILIKDVPVYPDKRVALTAHPAASEGDDILFFKEQAWNTDFALAPVVRRTIHDVIRTSGEIQPVRSDEAVVTARQDGLVSFRSANLEPGRVVRSGEVLFSLTTAGLLKHNLEEAFTVARARLERSSADLERAERLLEQQIIGQKEYEQRKMAFEVAQAEFATVSRGYADGGTVVRTPLSGIVKNVLIRDGAFVREGDPLVEVSRNRRLLLHADVSQRYLGQLSQIHSAHFRAPYHEEVQTLEDYHGRLVSSGQVIEDGSGFIPVLFELDNIRQLVPGAFVELFLLTTPIEDALVVPKSALLEEYGTRYVFVQTSGEHYSRREVQTGVDDGRLIEILAGVQEGEWIVTRGAYQVKLASMSAAIPEHGHEH